MDSDSEMEDSLVMAKSWDKMRTSVHKIGFVEGLSSGKEKAFQSGFDKGYAEGFCAGYNLGKLNGVLRVLQQNCEKQDATIETVKQINLEPNAKKGLCLLCNPENMESCLGNCIDDSLEMNVKSQKQIVKQAVDHHLEKVRHAYLYFNIAIPLCSKP